MTDISVIIAAYNVEAYIGHAIQSALDQQGVSVEIIVIDDASTDSTGKIVAAIADPRVKYIKLANNAGPAAARNAGIEAATGQWIAVLDGDDAFAPDRLKTCLDLAQRQKADIVIDNLSVRREEDGAGYPMFPSKWFGQLQTLDLATFIANNQSFLGGGIALGYAKPVISTVFLRRHNLRYNPSIRIGEDYMLMAEALALGARCAVEKSAGYLYTARTGSISHRLSLDDIKRIAKGDQDFLVRHPLIPLAANALKKRAYRLKEASAYTQLIDALKQRDISKTLAAIASCPSALRYLWMPVWARMKRMSRP